MDLTRPYLRTDALAFINATTPPFKNKRIRRSQANGDFFRTNTNYVQATTVEARGGDSTTDSSLTDVNDITEVVDFKHFQEATSSLDESLRSIDNIWLKVRETMAEIKQDELKLPPTSIEECEIEEDEETVMEKQTVMMADQAIIEHQQVVTEKDPILPKIVAILETDNEPCTKLKQQKKSVYNLPPHQIDLQKFVSTADMKKTVLKSRDSPTSKKQPDSVIQRYLKQSKSPTSFMRSDSPKRYSTPVISKKPSPVKTKPSASGSSSRAGPRLFGKEEVIPEIRLQMKELAKKLGIDELPRIRGQPNLHTQLIRELEATDSLLEFHRQMQHLAAKETDSTSKKRTGGSKEVVEIVAEELFVPERKINKIASTNLNSSSPTRKKSPQRSSNQSSPTPPIQMHPKTCHYIYKEPKKKAAKPASLPKTIEMPKSLKKLSNKKYPDSLFFSPDKKIESKSNKPVSVTNAAVVASGSSQSSIAFTTDNFSQSVQTDKSHRCTIPHVSYKTGLDCFDILDEVTLKDLQPFDAEYPRKDTIVSNPFYTELVENTYLYRMVYSSTRNEFLQLLRIEEPSIVCKEPKCSRCNNAAQTAGMWEPTKEKSAERTRPASPKKKERKDKKQSPVRKKPNKKQTKQEEDVATKLKPYMFDPHVRYPTSITVMPVAVTTFTNPNFDLLKTKQQSGGDSAKTSPKRPSTAAVTDKKLWNNKYSKSPGKNLVNYLEKQNKIAAQQGGDVSEERRSSSPVRKISKAPTKMSPSSLKTVTKPLSPRSAVKKHAADSRKLLKNIKNKSRTLESNIQYVIDLIENKIVDILSDPSKQTTEAFSRIEKEITDLLESMKNDYRKPSPPKQLEVIPEKNDCKTASALLLKVSSNEAQFNSETDQNLEESPQTTTSNTTVNLGCISSNEEKFMVTSSYEPTRENILDLDSSLEDPKTLSTIREVSKETVSKSETGKKQEDESTNKMQEKVSSLNALKQQGITKEVRSDEFLTPFMHAIKRYRNKEERCSMSTSSYDILEFLDTLTNLSEDITPIIRSPSEKQAHKIIHYQWKVQRANVFHEPEIAYSARVWFPVVYAITNHNLEILFQSDYFDKNCQVGMQENKPLAYPKIVCCLDQIRSYQENPIKELTCSGIECREGDNEKVQPAISRDHGLFLDLIYLILCTVVFLSLSLNYSCH